MERYNKCTASFICPQALLTPTRKRASLSSAQPAKPTLRALGLLSWVSSLTMMSLAQFKGSARPQGKLMLAAPLADGIKCVLVYDTKRLGRSQPVFWRFVETC